MSRPDQEPFIPETEGSGHSQSAERGGHRRQRRQLQQERRRAFRDRHFQEANIHGLRCREFEADLRLGERLMGGEPIRVKLTKTISFCRRLFLALLTCGFYELWFRCCACGSRVFDVDARMAVTSLGRLLLWTHTAGGGGLPLAQHFFRALTQPSAIIFIAMFVLFFAFGPVVLQTDILQIAGLLAAILGIAVVVVFWQWLFERASLQVDTGLRQFEANELSHTRLICYRNRSLWGLGGETLACQVYLFFGFYPKEQQLNRTLPPGMFDTGTVRAGFIPIGQPLDSSGAGLDASKLQAAAGQGNPTTTMGFTAVASAVLILLAFAGFLNEVAEFLAQWVNCVVKDQSLAAITECVEQRFDSWWTGGSHTGPQTVIAHWIEAFDWSLQLLLFIWVVGPTAFFLWKTLSDQSSAGLGFVVDRRLGASTEDEKFEEHWKELSSFVADLFQGACGDADTTETGCMPRQSLGAADAQRPKAMRWEEVLGDIQPVLPETEGGQVAPPQNEMEANAPSPDVEHQAASSSSSPYEPKAAARSRRRAPSWDQVEEMISHLIDPLTGKVRVYRDVLSFLPDEQVLAVYPEKIIMPIVAKVKIIITCGLEYYLHWRRQRRDGAIILTDKRLIHVATHFSRYRKSLKVDMYTVGKSVRYVGLRPARWQCCARPSGDLSVATRLGTVEVRLLQMKRLRDCAQRLWQGFAALQDTQSISSVEYDDWASVAEDLEESEVVEGNSVESEREILEEAKEAAGALWGDNSGDVAGDLEEGLGEEAPAEAQGNEDEGIVRFSATRAELWGLVMAPNEKTLWGPCLFEEEVFRACCPQRSTARNRRRPSALVTFTDRRLIVIQYRSVGPLCCGGICHRAPVDNVSIIPLKNVLGFSVEEKFSMQRAMIVKLMAKACCRPMSESFLCVKVLSNAALGKVYLDALSVRQRVLPLFADPPCNFEEDKVLELRRWLGNVALFFSGASEKVSQRPVLELWRSERGLAPE